MDEPDPWVRTFRETLPELYAFVARRARGDRELAEDVTQEAWLRAVRAWRAVGPPESQLAWLKTTASNLLANHFRDRTRATGGRRRVEVGELEQVATLDDEGKSVVIDGLARIPEPEAALLRAFHLDGRSTRELAQEHGISERAVEGRLRRARGRLARILRKRTC